MNLNIIIYNFLKYYASFIQTRIILSIISRAITTHNLLLKIKTIICNTIIFRGLKGLENGR